MQKKLYFLFIIICWGTVQMFLLKKLGIETGLEAKKYIDEADYFLQHKTFSQPKYLFYSTLIFVNIFSKLIGTKSIGVYIFQVLLNGLSTVYFYKFIFINTRCRTTAFIGVLLLIFCIPAQEWTTRLYTESIFLSIILILNYLLFDDRKNSFYKNSLILLVVVILVLTRPTGILFIPIILLYYGNLLKKNVYILIFSFIAVLIFIPLLNCVMQGKGELDFMKPFIEEHIICGVSTTAGPNTNIILPQNGNTIQGIVYYIINNPSHFAQLSAKKIIAFFGLQRSYYSSPHNLFLAIYFYPLYVLGIFGSVLLKKKKNNSLLFYFSCTILVFTTSVILTCDDWHNRFLLPILPLVFFLSALAIRKVAEVFMNPIANK